ncbi:MAG: DUF1244 domain-containing protein [Gammaproteobacteria bacterium]|nr:DUF1244 domain-containing protein [Gammaproteobacteria bacterium]MCY4312859.1 DUF1244 domain-containing protein [Gammaproteobacteria bacterium]
MSDLPKIDEQSRIEIEAALFRKLLGHLQKHPEVQNIDIMNLAYFCRNCFSKWYVSEAESHGIEVNYEQAREIVYGMPYADYRARYQNEASVEQLDRFADSQQKATE